MKARVKTTGEIVEVYHEPQHGQIEIIYKEAVFVNGRMWVEDELEIMKEDPVSEDLEEAAENYAKGYTCYANDCQLQKQTTKNAFKAGAEWQKEQMAKNALEADREEFPDGTFIYSTKNMIVDDMEWRGITDLDNVKIILYGLS